MNSNAQAAECGHPFLTAEAGAALGQLLRRIDFHSEVFFRGQLCDGWALDTSGSGKVSFHIVCKGECWLHLAPLGPARRLSSGDVVVFPGDAPHVISSSQQRPAAFGLQQITRQVPMARDRPGTALLCGYLEVERTARELLLAPLPEAVIVGEGIQSEVSRMRRLLELLFAEASDDAIGAAAVLDRLADAILFYVIRHALQQHAPLPGLLGALRDPRLRPALLAIESEPARRWTVTELANRAHLSRTVFAERFRSAMRMGPIEFLTLWRMYLARRLLEQGRASVMDIAARVGYASEAAFAKAFKRATGVSPGEVRRLASARTAVAVHH